MKSFKDYVTMNEAFKKGDSVTIKNAKSYDAMMKDTAEGTVIGTMGSKVMVKVGSGQLNVDPKDVAKAKKLLGLNERDSLVESGYVVTVAVRDARAANELAKDSYRNLYKNDGSDVFVFKKESDKEDFESELLDMGLEVLDEAVKLDEAKMYKSDYLSDSDVSYIMQAVGVSWSDFEKRVKNAIQKYLEMTLGNVQRITVTRANIGGYMFSQGGATRLLVDEILYEFRLDGESHQGAIKKQEIWVNL